MMIEYDQLSRSFSLTSPNITKLMNFIRSNFTDDKYCMSRVALQLAQIYDGDSQIKPRLTAIRYAQNHDLDEEDEPIDMRKLYFIGKTETNDLIAINKFNGEIFEFGEDNENEPNFAAANIRDFAKDNVDNTRSLTPELKTKAREFIRQLMNNV